MSNENFYNLNSNRQYPIDDFALFDAPSNILVDCNLVFPRSAGKYCYIRSINIGSSIVDILFYASELPAKPSAKALASAPDPLPEDVAIARLSIVKPYASYKIYQVNPLVAGVVGWCVLGDFQDVFHKVYTGVQYSQIIPKCGRVSIEPTVTGVEGPNRIFNGIVNLVSSTGLNIAAESFWNDDDQYRSVNIELIGRDDFNVWAAYSSPVGARPDSSTCNRTGIAGINQVQPDCDGNIEVIFRGGDVKRYAFDDGGGMEVDLPIDINQVCDPIPEHPTTPPEFLDDIDEGPDLIALLDLAPPLQIPGYSGGTVTSPGDPDAIGLDPYHDPRLVVPIPGGQVITGSCRLPRKIKVQFNPGRVSFGNLNSVPIDLTLQDYNVIRGQFVAVKSKHPRTYLSDCLPSCNQGVWCPPKSTLTPAPVQPTRPSGVPDSYKFYKYNSTGVTVRYYNYAGCDPRVAVVFKRYILSGCVRGCSDCCDCGTDECGTIIAKKMVDCSTAIDRQILHFGGLLDTQILYEYDDDDNLMFSVEITS
jgi:hypothetical protein